MKTKKKILIVGGTGFIGYHLAKLCLKKSWRVTSFSKNNPKKIRKLSNVKYIKGDLFYKKDLKKLKENFNYIVNLGGYVDHFNKSRTYNSHYVGCKNLSNYFLKKDIDAFVQMGSSGEYGKSKSPQKETMNCFPIGAYSTSKLLATNHLINLNKKYNFPCTILRLYQAFGEKQDVNRLIPIVITSCLKAKTFPCSDGKQLRDFIYVEDVTSAIIKSIINEDSKGKIFNLGTGRPIQVKKLILFIKNTIKKGKPEFGKVKLRRGESIKIFPSIKKIENTLKWKLKSNFYNKLKKTINYYKKNN